MLSFFNALRADLACYLGCVNLRDALAAKEARICFPTVAEVGSSQLHTQGLCDVCLQLTIDRSVVANTFDAGTMKLVMVTGADQGGKSTFLRSVGLGHLMSGAGAFTATAAFTASARSSVATHFNREEDNTLPRPGTPSAILKRGRDCAVNGVSGPTRRPAGRRER